MLAIFMAPFSVGVEINKAEAATPLKDRFTYEFFPSDITKSNRAVYKIYFKINPKCPPEDCKETREYSGGKSELVVYDTLKGNATIAGSKLSDVAGANIWFILKKITKNKEGKIEKEEEVGRKNWTQDDENGLKNEAIFITTSEVNELTLNTLWIAILDPETDYALYMDVPSVNFNNIKIGEWKTSTYNKDAPIDTPIDPGKIGQNSSPAQPSYKSYFDCSGIFPWNDLPCKVASLIYFAIFEPMAAFTWLAAKILDFFVYYSTNSSSYGGEFVNKAWGAVRDIANIFFIIALLFVAIKTILGLNVTDNKRIVGAVIIIALIINFSLFTTKVVIDTSNILAKVFYNNITSEDKNQKTLEAGAGGQKSISVGLVKQFDPQQIMTADQFKNQEGLFIFITVLAILLMGFMIYIFLSIAILFVSRVVSLWISMIFSPIAFVSYAVPFEIPGFGHKKWWDDLLKNAFLAPVFIFFLYIIILFGDVMKSIPGDVLGTASGTEGFLDAAMKVIIPFAIIFMLLLKAKKIAVEFSGEMGKAVMTAGKMIGGVALGAATGGAAMLGRTAIGGGGGYLANKLAEKIGPGRISNKLRDVSDFARKSSFDARRVKIAGQSMASVTGMKVGEGQKGGWNEMKKQQVEKRQKRAEELEKRGTGVEKKAVDNAEIALKEKVLSTTTMRDVRGNPILDANGNPKQITVKLALENFDKDIEKARKELSDAKLADDGHGSNAPEIAAAKAQLDDAKTKKENLRNDRSAGPSIKDLETVRNEKKTNLDVASDKITTEYAKKISSGTNKIMNQIFRLGAYSRAGADEANRKIRTGTKLDSGEKPH